MPASLSQLVRNKRRIDIPLEDGASIFIEYRPAAITPRLEEEINAAREDAATKEQVFTAVAHYLLTAISAWDVLDTSGNVIPLTAEGFHDHVDYESLMLLFDTITTDAQMGEATGANSQTPSESTSKPKAKRATSRQ